MWRTYVTVALVVLGITVFIVVMAVAMVNGDHNRDRRNERNYADCVARGGTVILDSYNDYDGCKIGPQGG